MNARVEAGAPLRSRKTRMIVFSLLLVAAAVVGCSHLKMMMGTGVERPPASEFGYGPRRSTRGLYEAMIETDQALRTRRMQQVKLKVHGPDRSAVVGAEVTVDGGMPQHGHGLPTRPRVTGTAGEGIYVVDGVRFNMGGWWELKFQIALAAGVDTVTFNLDL